MREAWIWNSCHFRLGNENTPEVVRTSGVLRHPNRLNLSSAGERANVWQRLALKMRFEEPQTLIHRTRDLREQVRGGGIVRIR